MSTRTDVIQSYENTLKDMEEFLAPEWEEAKDEVFASYNYGWLMIAKLAIRKRLEKLEQAKESE
jgi:hypothetical protein